MDNMDKNRLYDVHFFNTFAQLNQYNTPYEKAIICHRHPVLFYEFHSQSTISFKQSIRAKTNAKRHSIV